MESAEVVVDELVDKRLGRHITTIMQPGRVLV
jgi:hypothetical protein